MKIDNILNLPLALATRYDLQLELAPVKSDLHMMKWMMGLILGGVVALVLESFF